MNHLLKIICQLSLLLWLVVPASGQQLSVSAGATGEWRQGSWSRMEVVISGAESSGPCRVVQDFPTGFLFRAVELSGSDMFPGNNSLNIVWARMPAGKSVRVIYEVMPGAEVSGSVEIPGRFYWVNKANSRVSVAIPAVNIAITPVPGAMETGRLSRQTEGGGVQQTLHDISDDKGSSMVSFRVQILTSSSFLTDQELKKRLGITFNDKVTVVQAGNLYRYQTGECPSYECALEILERFTKAGTVGAFITAFQGGDQITVEQARALTRK
ncbi:MAG: hypothetical protein R6W67_03470 [Bacteroidales bacterium]